MCDGGGDQDAQHHPLKPEHHQLPDLHRNPGGDDAGNQGGEEDDGTDADHPDDETQRQGLLVRDDAGGQEHLGDPHRGRLPGEHRLRQPHQPGEGVEEITQPVEDRGEPGQQQADQTHRHDGGRDRRSHPHPIPEIQPDRTTQGRGVPQNQQALPPGSPETVAAEPLGVEPEK